MCWSINKKPHKIHWTLLWRDTRRKRSYVRYFIPVSVLLGSSRSTSQLLARACRACVRAFFALRLTSVRRPRGSSTRPLSHLSLSLFLALPLSLPLPPSLLPLLLFLPDSEPLRRYAYVRVSLCKASTTGESRTLLLTAGREQYPQRRLTRHPGRATGAGETPLSAVRR